MWRGEKYIIPIANRNPYIKGMDTCFCADLVPTLATDTGRSGTTGESGVGMSTGCESFGGIGRWNPYRRGDCHPLRDSRSFTTSSMSARK